MPSQVRVVFNDLPKLAAMLGVNADKVVQDTAEAIADSARGDVPVLEGELQDSIKASQVGDKHWQVVAGTDHAVYVEYGTAKHGAAQPYMVPSAHRAEPVLVAGMQQLIPGG